MWGSLALALIAGPGPAWPGSPHLVETGNVALASDDPDFGGLSGLEISDDGNTLYVVTDRGLFFELDVARGASGTISSVDVRARKNLNRPDAKHYLDTEGLASLPGGGFVISLEGPARVGRLLPGDDHLTLLPKAPQDRVAKTNRGFEAVALTPSGAVLTSPEDTVDAHSSIPVYRFADKRWTLDFEISMRRDFSLVGADFGPDGSLYILERAFSPLGFRSRISRVDTQANPATKEVLLSTRLGKYDNLEGMAVWRDGDGTLRLIAVSDNNFLAIQEQHLVEFVLQE